MNIHIDFETYSECDLRKAGAWSYSLHPSTVVICCAYAVGNDEPVLLGESELECIPRVFDGATLHAWNSFFEYAIWVNCLGWPETPIERWNDTAARAAFAALPRSLGECGKVLGLPEDAAKLQRGRYLISRLSKPRNGERCLDADLLEEMYEYCRRDVIAERELSRRLPELPDSERNAWVLDQKINLRGLYVDRKAVTSAIRICSQATKLLEADVSRASGGELNNVRQIQRVATFCAERGVGMGSLTKACVAETLERDDLPEDVRAVLELRQRLGKTSTAKFDALLRLIDHVPDDRARGLLRYHGASTGRWSGSNFQPQNLPRGEFPDASAEDFRDEDDPADAVEWLQTIYGDPLSALSSAIRSVITAPPGRRLIVADYAAIEARVLPWLAGQADVLEVFRGHGKIYEHTASQIYRKPLGEITKDERFVGKVATLALGYQGGAKAFRQMAEAYGVDISDDLAERVKLGWRDANRQTVRYWYAVERAAVDAVRNPGEVFRCRSAAFKASDGFLLLRLPSGRPLRYFKPDLKEGKFGREQVTFEGRDSVTGKFRRQTTYGGKLVENITQAVARDLMLAGMFNVENAGYDVVLTVHDELIVEADNGFGSAADVERLMCDAPTWADGLPLRAEGFETQRYRKG